MALTKTNDTALHEAAHGILAYLASEIFEIRFITINQGLSRTQDASSLGGIRGRLKSVASLTTKDHDVMTLVCLAGMAADDVNHYNGIISNDLYDNFNFANKLNSVKYSGDRELLIPHLANIMTDISINQREYTISCQKTLYEMFCNKSIRDILINLATKLENHPNKTLTGMELTEYLDGTMLKKWRANEWNKILEKRSIKMKRKLSFWKKLSKVLGG